MGKHFDSNRTSHPGRTDVSLKVLSLVAWFGIEASLILDMLLTDPALKGVQTLVKTERLDTGKCASQKTVNVISQLDSRVGSISTCRLTFSEVWKPCTSSSLTDLYSRYPERREIVKTQATCKVGSRFEGSKSNTQFVKGAGMRIGYECWCFVQSSSQYNEKINDSEQVVAGNKDKVRSHLELTGEDTQEEKDPLFRLNPRFHIIIQGRYEAQDALMLEDTLDKSFITCNHCKNEILF